jgi:hypothetical protein
MPNVIIIIIEDAKERVYSHAALSWLAASLQCRGTDDWSTIPSLFDKRRPGLSRDHREIVHYLIFHGLSKHDGLLLEV